MPRSLVLGNGNLLVCLDANAIVRDLFFGMVGQENHVGGHRHHIGIWVDGQFSWLEDGAWKKGVGYQKETMIGLTEARNDAVGLVLEFHDFVYNEKDIFIRKIVVRNERDHAREVRLFFAQEFQIGETQTGNSAFYEPVENIVVHYKGRRVFLINGRVGKEGISEYAVGETHHRGLEGTWRDAEDGVLSKNPVSHGSVDSCVSFRFGLPAKGKETAYYWIAAGKSLVEARALNAYVLDRKPHHLLETTQDFWWAWVHTRKYDFWGLSDEIVRLFKLSLLVIRTHVDNRGAIIASADSDFLQHGRDTYAYMWPRDGALVAKALDNAGYFENTHEFFKFCNEVIMPEGYLLHKYLCDKSLGSSWHPWVGEGGHPHLPIQEDETALVLHALQNHFERKRDLEFIESVYNSFIKPAANFLETYRNEKTKLPRPSYDLWEERRSIFTFTCSSVYGGLRSAAFFAKLLGKAQQANRYAKAAKEVREGILKHLYDAEKGYFIKSVRWTEDGQLIRDETIDASAAFGVMEFGVLDPDDKRLVSAMEETRKALWVPPVGGIARYTNDYYYRARKDAPGNAWFICTMWYAQHLIRRAKTERDLQPAREIMSWVCRYAMPSGVLSEQLHPDTGAPLSATPLTWSHATFVLLVLDYLEKVEELGICETCLPYRK
jgi:oligosaccharide amylase